MAAPGLSRGTPGLSHGIPGLSHGTPSLKVQSVGSSFLTRDRTWALCIGSMES